ncbi:MAG: hypothetical protein R3213_08485 [Flavobacteriaceae bacterium]|nr:hypothetical protein [Flavobacteriaceae bacterium]
MKITAWLPIYADAKFEIEKPDDWAKMDEEEKVTYFLENMQEVGFLCHSCNCEVETDFQANDSVFKDNYTPEFYEEDN